MAALVTTAGGTHFTELTAGGALTETFNTLIFDRGNVTPAVGDTTAVLTNQIVIPVQTALPALDNQDPRNTGAGATTWTWEFRVAAMASPVVASSVALGTSSTTALCIHADDIVNTDPTRDLLLWFNLASTSVATLIPAFEENVIETARQRGYATADVLYGGRGSQVLSPGRSTVTIRAGEKVVLRARVYGQDQQPVRPSDVTRIYQVISKYDGASGRWLEYRKKRLPDTSVSYANGVSSALFPYRGGYNFEAEVSGVETRDGLDRRIEYRLDLSDGSTRVLEQRVRVAG